MFYTGNLISRIASQLLHFVNTCILIKLCKIWHTAFRNCFSALKSLAPYMVDSSVQHALLNPAVEVDLKIVEVCLYPLCEHALQVLCLFFMSESLLLFMWFLGQVPRQVNGTDCGFYVMAYMRYLVAGILQGNRNKGKNWVSFLSVVRRKDVLGAWHLIHFIVYKCLQLTKDWFHFEDVCTLRMDLHRWCFECLNHCWLCSYHVPSLAVDQCRGTLSFLGQLLFFWPACYLLGAHYLLG